MKKLFVRGTMLILFCFIGLTGCQSQAAYQKMYDDEEQLVTGTENYKRKGSLTVVDNEVTSKMKLSGVETLWELGTDDDEKEIAVDYDVSVKKGKYKIIFVNGEQQVEKVCEGSQKGTQKLRLTKGKNYIKMVGVDSDEEIKLHIDTDDEVELKFEMK